MHAGARTHGGGGRWRWAFPLTLRSSQQGPSFEICLIKGPPPGPHGLCDNLIQDIIYSYLVLPNRITIPLVGEVQLAQLRFPMPKGVLRIHFLEAQDLEGKDKFMGGLIKGKSDPYGVIQMGNQLFQTKTIKENIHPKWNEVYEAMVYEHSGQHLEIELFDEDPDKDDFLGSLSGDGSNAFVFYCSLMIDLTELHKEQKVDQWFVLEEVSTGKLHLRLEWLSLLSTPEKLDQTVSHLACHGSQFQKQIKERHYTASETDAALMSIKAEKGQANDGLSSAVLVVYLDSARNLPVSTLPHTPTHALNHKPPPVILPHRSQGGFHTCMLFCDLLFLCQSLSALFQH
ncbi:hypothetical protein JZ751_000035 [Albula glossodonta]|uniref:C2 domain-containing protein n=1 Tax=Albula glossodonta TaxID=121402 RepID=A0A8T2PUS0_9TELE|nr:hypothetical protein JZ751_000035 [Albula glossodonta]